MNGHRITTHREDCYAALFPDKECNCPSEDFVPASEFVRYREAVKEAMWALMGGDGPPDTTSAQVWLRTTLREDHPNYMSRAEAIRLAGRGPG